MSLFDRISGLAIVALLSCSTAQADIYKCLDDDGNAVFQQTPCPEKTSEKVASDAVSSSETDCTFAGKFAVSSARFMRAGIPSDQLFDRYGGLDSLSRGSLGVINYVYSFRSNDDVSVDRIAALTQAKCQASAFGDVSCEAMPLSFTESLGGCDASDEERRAAEAQQGVESVQTSQQPVHLAAPRSTSSTRSPEDVATCKQHYRDAIDEIDAEMRRGYSSEQGEAYRQQLRGLTEKLRSC
jgi:hypothetical protein